MLKEIKEDIQKQLKAYQKNMVKNWEDTKIITWTQRGFKQTWEQNQGNYFKKINEIKEAIQDVKRCERGA
jgi:hypothetical protein